MPTETDHISLANKCYDALCCLLDSPSSHSEWVVTIAFYKALHVVSAIASREGKKCNDHVSRHDWLKCRFPDIWKHYRVLWQASSIARYLHDKSSRAQFSTFDDYCRSEKVYDRFVKRRLRSVDEIAVSRLSDDARNALKRVPST